MTDRTDKGNNKGSSKGDNKGDNKKAGEVNGQGNDSSGRNDSSLDIPNSANPSHVLDAAFTFPDIPLEIFVESLDRQGKALLFEFARANRYNCRNIQSYLAEHYDRNYLVSQIASFLKTAIPLSYRVEYINQQAEEIRGLNVEGANRLLYLRLYELLNKMMTLVDDGLDRGLVSVEDCLVNMRGYIQESCRLGLGLERAEFRDLAEVSMGGAQEFASMLMRVFNDTPYEEAFREAADYGLRRIEQEQKKMDKFN